MPNYVVVGSNSDVAKSFIENLKEDCKVFTISKSERVGGHFSTDATDFTKMDEAFKKAEEFLGKIDGVVNFCGSVFLKPAHLTSFDGYISTVHASLTTAFATVRSGVKVMKGGGAIVLISSAVASLGLPNHEAISSAKAGVVGLAKSAAATYANKNIRVNVVCPGLVNTKLTKAITQSPQALEFSLKMHGLSRVGTPNDVASAVEFLLNPENNWITGSVLNVDGGLGTVKV